MSDGGLAVLSSRAVQFDSPGGGKRAVLEALARRLPLPWSAATRRRFLARVLAGERRRPAAVAPGISVPYACAPRARRLALAALICHRPLDLGNLRERQTQLVLLVAAPGRRPARFLAFQAALGRLLGDGRFLALLLAQETPGQAATCLRRALAGGRRRAAG